MAIAVFTSLQQLLDNSAAPLNGGSVTVYLAGTTTLVSLFTADDLTGAAANPITLNSAGRHSIRYMAAAKYKVLIKDSGGTTLVTIDNIDPAVPLGSGTLAVANGGTGAATAAAARTNLGAASTSELADLAADIAASATATDKTHLATGTTAERPSVPVQGDVRRNTTTSLFEGYNGSAWVPFINAAGNITDFTPTVQRLTSGSGATYTRTSANVKRQRVRMVGAGGGGAGATANNGGNGSAATSFQVDGIGTAWTAAVGNGGTAAAGAGGSGGSGGTDGSTGNLVARISGGYGGSGGASGTSGVQSAGGIGGSSAFGGAGRGGAPAAGGQAGRTNSGGGGGGGGAPNTSASGGGGGAGEYVEFWVSGMTTATYTIGTGGTAGSAGGQAGGAGADGLIIVEEFYI